MSNINIQRAIENIRSTTTVFTPIVETVVNAIEAIEAADRKPGLVQLRVRRSTQGDVDSDGEGSRILDVIVSDNGIGFTQQNRDSFDTLYTAQKIKQGGKGFGRLTCLRYFDEVRIDSTFGGEPLQRRQFDMGKVNELIVNELLTDSTNAATGTTVTLEGERTGKLPRRLSTIARGLVELLLPYFTTRGYSCPRIQLSEHDGSGQIVLNDYVDSPGAIIHEVSLQESSFVLPGAAGPQTFETRVFKFLSPQNKISKVSLVAHKREVTEAALSNFVPEFSEEFVEDPGGDQSRRRNYILKAYVFGSYLDENVELERGTFRFHRDSELLLGVSQTQIEEGAAQITKAAVLEQVVTRQERKREKLQTYVESQAPWYKPLMRNLDIAQLSPVASESDMEAYLHREKYKQERRISRDVAAVLASGDPSELADRARELVSCPADT
jgi:hypothetical protein